MDTQPQGLDPAFMPDTTADAKKLFGFDVKMKVPAFSRRTEYVPELDNAYRFDRETTLAILAGFAFNRRVMIQGYHGTGKSTHIEQVAARLNWPVVRINLDSHISRIDLIGKDAIVVRDGKQVTEFREGLLPWCLQHPVALTFDEYDAGRPDVMFVIQRVLEVQGKLTLLDQNKVIRPHPAFRLFSTTNTIGLGDTTGLYHGTQQINHGQMDRWSIVTTLNYLHQRRSFHRDEPAYRHHLGRERRNLQRHRLRLPPHLPQQMRRAGTRQRCRVLPAGVWRGIAGKCGEGLGRVNATKRIANSEWRIEVSRHQPSIHYSLLATRYSLGCKP